MSGELAIQNHTGAIQAHTVNGDITASGEISRFTSDGVSGDVYLDISGRTADEIRVNTVNGDITARLEEGNAAEYRINTVNGRIQLDDTEITGVRGNYSGKYGNARALVPRLPGQHGQRQCRRTALRGRDHPQRCGRRKARAMPPVFGHGHLRLYLLSLLDESPKHGYELIQALEDRFGGTYIPSAGTIYPRLAKLEEEGLVTKEADGRKTVYSITDAGRAELHDREGELGGIEDEVTDSVRRLADEVRTSVNEAMKSLRADLAAAARDARRDGARTAGRTVHANRGNARREPQSRSNLQDAEIALQEFRHEIRSRTARMDVARRTHGRQRSAPANPARRACAKAGVGLAAQTRTGNVCLNPPAFQLERTRAWSMLAPRD